MVHPKHHHSIAVVVLLGIVLLFALLLFSLFVKDNKGTTEVVSDSETQDIYISKLNDFSIDLTGIDHDEIEENYNFNSIVTSLGDIDLTINGTNYDNLNDYIYTFDSRRNISVTNSYPLKIDNHEAIVREEFFEDEGTNEKAYFIYVNNSIYIFSTDSPDLYDELDQVAQSFKYLPPDGEAD